MTHDPKTTPRRTKSEVLVARRHAVTGGCCDRFAERRGCDCPGRAVDDLPAGRACPDCRGGGRITGDAGRSNLWFSRHPERLIEVSLECVRCGGTGRLPGGIDTPNPIPPNEGGAM